MAAPGQRSGGCKRDWLKAKRFALALPYSTLRLRKRQSLAISNAPVRDGSQAFPALAFEHIDLRQHGGNILALLIEHGAARGKDLQEFEQLRALALGRLIKIEQLADLGKGKSEPLATQDQLDAHPLALGVDAPAPRPARREQSLVLIKADGARRQREFPGEIGNTVGEGFRPGRRGHGSDVER